MMKHAPHSVAALPSEAIAEPRSGGSLRVMPSSGASALKKLATVIALCAITGCGFRPAHSVETRAGYTSQIESVEIVTDSSRPSQMLKAEIEDLANPTARRSEKLFILSIIVTENETPLFINPDGTSGRGDYLFTSNYTLKRKFDNKVIDTGSLTRSSSYNNALTADFSTFVSREAAHKRGLMELAQDYKLRLANLVPKLNDPNAKPSTRGLTPRPPVTRPLDPANNDPDNFELPLGDTDETDGKGQ